MAQARLKGSVLLNAGASWCNSYRKPVNLGLTSDQTLVRNGQKGLPAINLNLMYFFKETDKKLRPVVGFIYAPQGIIENGYTTDSVSELPYRYTFKFNTVGIAGGFTLPLFKGKKIELGVNQTVNILIRTETAINMRRVLPAEKTELMVHIKSKNNHQTVLAPFFQSGLMRWNRTRLHNLDHQYIPYCFGLIVGAYFR